MSANSLARLWQSRGFAADRLLFLTYEFNFRDFHDQVLRRLLENAAGRRPSVDVIAARVDMEEESDCFDFRYLASFGNRFRLFRCDSLPLAHAKAVIARDSRTGRRLSGFGSANLTPSGWRRNLEVWSWDDGRSAAGILEMCEALERRNGIKSGLATEWRAWFGVTRANSPITVLGAPGAPSFEEMFQRLLRAVERPRIVRVASPYFDRHSADMFESIFRETGRCRLEIWTDRSGRLTEPTHWRIIVELLPTLAKTFGDVQVLAPPRDAPWHAKVVELEDGRGRVARVFGSANFTGAGWAVKHAGNLELVAVDAGKGGLPDLLETRKIKMTPVLGPERMRLARQEEKEQVPRSRGPVLLWACLAEKPKPEIVARLARSEKVVAWRLEAGFDESRPDDEREKLKKIRERVISHSKWRFRQTGREIVLDWCGSDFIACERMTLKVRTASGSCAAPIWVPEPDWARRDKRTGIPIAPESDQWSIDALLSGQRPIVSLRRRSRDPGHDEEASEELNTAPEPPLSIEHPDYDHEPELMLLARRLRESSDSVEVIRRRLETIVRKGQRKDRLLANVALAALTER